MHDIIIKLITAILQSVIGDAKLTITEQATQPSGIPCWFHLPLPASVYFVVEIERNAHDLVHGYFEL